MGATCSPALPLPLGACLCLWPIAEKDLHTRILRARTSVQNVTQGALQVQNENRAMRTNHGGFQKQGLGVCVGQSSLNCS